MTMYARSDSRLRAILRTEATLGKQTIACEMRETELSGPTLLNIHSWADAKVNKQSKPAKSIDAVAQGQCSIMLVVYYTTKKQKCVYNRQHNMDIIHVLKFFFWWKIDHLWKLVIGIGVQPNVLDRSGDWRTICILHTFTHNHFRDKKLCKVIHEDYSLGCFPYFMPILCTRFSFHSLPIFIVVGTKVKKFLKSVVHWPGQARISSPQYKNSQRSW